MSNVKYLYQLAKWVLKHEDIIAFQDEYARVDNFWIKRIGFAGFEFMSDISEKLEQVRLMALQNVVSRHFMSDESILFSKEYNEWQKAWETTFLVPVEDDPMDVKRLTEEGHMISYYQLPRNKSLHVDDDDVMAFISSCSWEYDSNSGSIANILRPREGEKNINIGRKITNFAKAMYYLFLQSDFKDNFFKKYNIIKGIINKNQKDVGIFAIFLWCYINIQKDTGSDILLITTSISSIRESPFTVDAMIMDLFNDPLYESSMAERATFLRRYSDYIHYESYAAVLDKKGDDRDGRDNLMRLDFNGPGMYIIQNCVRSECIKFYNVQKDGHLRTDGPTVNKLIPVVINSLPYLQGCYHCRKRGMFFEATSAKRIFCSNECFIQYHNKY